MASFPAPPKGFMSLPRELRDQIYSCLLVSKYQVDISPTMRYGQPLEANGSYSAYTPEFSAISEPLFTFEKPSNCVAILLVNKAISQEAKEEFYKHSTFVFRIGSSIGPCSIDFRHIKAMHWMQRIEIIVDLQEATKNSYEEEKAAVDSAHRLLLELHSSRIKRRSCVVEVRYTSGIVRVMLRLLQVLTSPSYKDFELRIAHPFSPNPLLRHVVDSQNDFLLWLDQHIEPHLGPGECGYDENRVFVMKYHPCKFAHYFDFTKLPPPGDITTS